MNQLRQWPAPNSPRTLSGLMRPVFVKVKNRSGASLAAGTVVKLLPTSATMASGLILPCTVGAGPGGLIMGAVRYGWPTLADGHEGEIQVAGLHPGVLCDNTLGALANGDFVTLGAVSGVAAKTPTRADAFGVYCDAAYDSATAAAKKVWLINPMGVV